MPQIEHDGHYAAAGRRICPMPKAFVQRYMQKYRLSALWSWSETSPGDWMIHSSHFTIACVDALHIGYMEAVETIKIRPAKEEE